LLLFDPNEIVASGRLRWCIQLAGISSVNREKPWADWTIELTCEESRQPIRFYLGGDAKATRDLQACLRAATAPDRKPATSSGRPRTARTIVFLHGAGGPEARARWLSPLNARLAQLGYPRLDAALDVIIDPDYIGALTAPPATTPYPPTLAFPGMDAYKRARELYNETQKQLKKGLAPHSASPAGISFTGGIARPFAEWGASNFKLFGVSEYINSAEQRRTVWGQIFKQLPDQGEVLFVGYSLGSVVLADLLPRLPAGLTVCGVVTVGSPLALNVLRKETVGLEAEFPYDRVRAWINLYDRRDESTIGGGIATGIRQALDVEVDNGTSHDVFGYMSQPATAEAIGSLLFGDSAQPSADAEPLMVLIPMLLLIAYSSELSRTCRTKESDLKGRLDAAREESIALFCDLLGRNPDASTFESAEVAERELRPVFDAPRLWLAELWSDQELAALLVALHLSPSCVVFDVKVDDDHCRRALESLVDSLRRQNGEGQTGHAAAVVAAADQALRLVDNADRDLSAAAGSRVARTWITAAGKMQESPLGRESVNCWLGPQNCASLLVAAGLMTGLRWALPTDPDDPVTSSPHSLAQVPELLLEPRAELAFVVRLMAASTAAVCLLPDGGAASGKSTRGETRTHLMQLRQALRREYDRHLQLENSGGVVDDLRRRAEVVEATLGLVEKLTVAT
jgi:hypothetical protein